MNTGNTLIQSLKLILNPYGNNVCVCLQVLVKELQAEESSWTQYDEDEAAVKTQVACEIFDSLIEETVTLVTSILARKMTCAAH